MIPMLLECERCGRDFEGLPSKIEDLCLPCMVAEIAHGESFCDLPANEPVPYVPIEIQR